VAICPLPFAVFWPFGCLRIGKSAPFKFEMRRMASKIHKKINTENVYVWKNKRRHKRQFGDETKLTCVKAAAFSYITSIVWLLLLSCLTACVDV
jgi:hypothetical protein